jgi:hypothetical protein
MLNTPHQSLQWSSQFQNYQLSGWISLDRSVLSDRTYPPIRVSKAYTDKQIYLRVRILCSVDRASRYNARKWPPWRKIPFYIFISILYMFRATSCSSSGESTVSIQHLVCFTLCRWPSSMRVGMELPDLHPRWSPTKSDTYQILYWYNSFSWWWARARNM